MTEIAQPNHAVEVVPNTLDVDPLTRFSEQYREGVAEGNPIACVDLGLCYLEGFGVPQDFDEAARLFRLACDWDSNSTALNLLGLMHIYGLGVEHNVEKGLQLLRQSAEAGDRRAMYQLGHWYFENKSADPDGNITYFWLKYAELLGHNPSCLLLGNFFRDGREGEICTESAAHLYQKLVGLGDYPEAMVSLAQLYWKGNGIRRNTGRAVDLYAKAMDQGSCNAAHELGLIFGDKLSSLSDLERAFKLFEHAALGAHTEAMWQLENCYRTGSGVKKNVRMAREWAAIRAKVSRPTKLDLQLKQLKDCYWNL